MKDFFDSVEKFFAREVIPHINDWDEAGSFPKELYAKAGEMGLLALGYPEQYGGVECSFADRFKMTEIVSKCGSGGLMASLFSHNIALPPLLARGSQTLCERIVPDVLAGRKIAALAITEPGGGSDVANIRTRAVKGSDAHGEFYEISGEKTFITSGMRADWYTVAVRTGDPSELPGAKGISLIMVPGDALGFSKTPLKKMGWWMSDTATLHFDKVRVPADHLIGQENKGFRAIMENFNAERLMLSAGSLAFAQLCFDEALQWAQDRKTFGSRLLDHQAIRHTLADMQMDLRCTRAWLQQTIHNLDTGNIDMTVVADICLLKNQATQTMHRCADRAVNILGGMGFMRGTVSERIYREVKVMQIGGGATEIMKELAAKQLGW